MKKSKITAIILSILVVLCVVYTGNQFMSMWEDVPVYPSENLTEIKMLSDYFPKLKGTPGDTEIYIYKGEKEGSSILIIGGTHPNEPASNLAAITLIENIDVDAGTVYIIAEANKSAFTHNDPQEGSPQGYYLDTRGGKRWFKYGSRATNPIHQWPDPDIYVHASSGQKLSGSETRNLNRGYPGKEDGTYTEQICYGIVELIKNENITITVDLHEASPEYPVINAMVAHENAMTIASTAVMNMQFKDVNIGLEPSPTNLHGLSHRELGDYTDTFALLMETANPSQGRLRGATNAEMVLTGKDDIYVDAAKIGALFVPFDENGHPMEERVARHITGIEEIINSYNELYKDEKIEVFNVPTYEDLTNNGIGLYLN